MRTKPDVEDLHRHFAAHVLSLFRKFGHSAEDGEELTQEVFIRIYKGIGSYRGDGMTAWILTIARNVHREALRKRSTRRRSHRAVALEEAEELATEASQFRAIEKAEANERLKKRIRELPDEEQRCLRLFYFQGYTYAEIARILGISPNRVRELLRKARQGLRTPPIGDDQDV